MQAAAAAGEPLWLRPLFGTIDAGDARGFCAYLTEDAIYTRHDGSEVTLPFADTMVTRDGRLAEYRIYIDIAPLYAAQQ